MYRDVSAVDTQNCAVISSPDEITTYSRTTRKQYSLIGNKYYLRNQTASTNYNYGDYVCYTQQQLQKLPSNYDFITPIYYEMAFYTFILLVLGAFYLIIYPFYRRKV